MDEVIIEGFVDIVNILLPLAFKLIGSFVTYEPANQILAFHLRGFEFVALTTFKKENLAPFRGFALNEVEERQKRRIAISYPIKETSPR